MPIQILWGDDQNSQNKFIQELIDRNVSQAWREVNVTNLNGEYYEQIVQAMDEVLTPPLGDGSRIVILKNNPIFTTKDEDLRIKFEKISNNIPKNTYLILQNSKKPDSRLKSTKFIQKIIKEKLAFEKAFCLPNIWDFEGQKKYLEDTAKSMNIKIETDAAELIIDSVGNDSFKLMNELEKAKNYLAAIATDSKSQLFLRSCDVKKIFNDHQSNIFKIVDLLLQKNIHATLIEINYLLQNGEPAIRFNAGLISQIRIHSIVKIATDSGEENLNTICDLAKISNPKRIYFIKKKVKNISQDYLINLMSNLLNIESLLKKGNNPINVFTESLVNLN